MRINFSSGPLTPDEATSFAARRMEARAWVTAGYSQIKAQSDEECVKLMIEAAALAAHFGEVHLERSRLESMSTSSLLRHLADRLDRLTPKPSAGSR